jgi:hypothetical protein
MSETKVTLEQQLEQLVARVTVLEEQLQKSNNKTQKEMTDEDARNILFGDCKNLKHNECVTKLGLSYGQIYSCRGEYTFRHIWKELRNKEPGFVNPWKKK